MTKEIDTAAEGTRRKQAIAPREEDFEVAAGTLWLGGGVMQERTRITSTSHIAPNEHLEAIPPPLADRVMPSLVARLVEEGNFLTAAQIAALRDIPVTIEDMANGKAGNAFYLSDPPPGMGKTTALAETVKAMLADPETYGRVGILILLNQLNLIPPLIERMGLALDDPRLGVFVGKDNQERTGLPYDLNELGGGPRNEAQVVISTQAMFVRLYDLPIGKRFEKNRAYYYHGKRRDVVVWDEAASPTHPISITTEDIRQAAARVAELGKQTMADELWSWARELEQGNAPVSIVPSWDLYGSWDETEIDVSQEWQTVEWALSRMQGQAVHIHRDPYNKAVVVSYFQTLPDDFAPVLILDAFGRRRQFYQLWQKRRGNLLFLREAPKSYRGLTFHWINLPGGKVAHRTPDQRQNIVRAGIAAHFKSDGPMLNVIHKPTEDYDIEADMRRCIKAAGGDPERDGYVTWGLHTGVNDYRDSRHAFVGGLLRKPRHHYKALYRGAAQLGPLGREEEDLLADVERSEITHDLQQAVGRIAVRQNRDGDIPEGCHVWLTTPSKGWKPLTAELLREAFPGSTVEHWSAGMAPKVRADSGLDRVAAVLMERPGEWITTRQVKEAVGLHRDTVLGHLKSQVLKDLLNAQGLEVEDRPGKGRGGAGGKGPLEWRSLVGATSKETQV